MALAQSTAPPLGDEDFEPRFYERGIFKCASAMPTRDSRRAFCYVSLILSVVLVLVGLPLFAWGMVNLQETDEEHEARTTVVLFFGLLLAIIGFGISIIVIRIHFAMQRDQRNFVNFDL
eukprot:c27173_g1_i1.p2 GENE.c27173_g1_i1~~c27173_g1_i1.p2  ORF type:complete len:119 (-),score=24.83 c27173_g1_i1:48-404(-)